MFDVPVFGIMCAVVVAANVIAIPKVIAYSDLYRNARAERISVLSAMTQGILLSVGACAIGSFTAPRAGLGTPFLEAIIQLDQPHIALWSQLWPAIVSSLYVMLGLIILQLAFVRRHVSTSAYYSTPLSAKILLEGVVEEVIYRWGVMSVIVRILNVEFLADTNAAMMMAILLAAVASSLSRISDLSRLNFDRISMALLAVLLVNFWGALCYGWLFWRHGLTAAILCHVLVVTASVMIYRVKDFLAFPEADTGV